MSDDELVFFMERKVYFRIRSDFRDENTLQGVSSLMV